ncbi:hypothetical protein AB0F93_28365 [Micromonospora tulbaghiae]|uniref:hypothetical protein n=1 Tax=Micromonospora tulbaghiae TaxID=479978 RepID=UPI003329D189
MTGADSVLPLPVPVPVPVQLTLAAHRATPGGVGPAPGCPSCTPTGCPQRDWASREQARLAGITVGT